MVGPNLSNNTSNVGVPRVNPKDLEEKTASSPSADDAVNAGVEGETGVDNDANGSDNQDGNNSNQNDDKTSDRGKNDGFGDSEELEDGKSNGKSKGKGKDKNGKGKDKKNDGLEDDDDGSPSKQNKSNSNESSENDDGNDGQSTKEQMKQIKKRVSAGQSAFQAAQVMMWISKFLMMMRMLLQMIAQAIMSFIQMLIGIVVNIFHAVVGIATTIATAFGISVVTAIAGFGGIIAIVVIVVVATVVSSNITDNAIRSDVKIEYDCRTGMAEISGGLSDTDVTAQKLANAKLIYSVFHEYGFADNNIAGILANWDSESGIDPTSVETIYTEPYEIGPKKQKAWDNGFDIEKINSSYAAKYPAIDLCGIGLGQWTNGRNTQLLTYASATGLNWYDLSVQLAFMITPEENGGDSGSSFLANWAPEDDAYTATKVFCEGWEGNSKAAKDENRLKKGPLYAVEIMMWNVDMDYANSVIAMAGSVSVNATDGAAKSVAVKCDKGRVVSMGNGSIAQAAVSYAWPTTDEGRGNNGTELYQTVHDAIFPGNPTYMSCDMSVACAVRWAGADDEYPEGDVQEQLRYLQKTTDKWQEIDWGGDINNLQPGDVLICYEGSGDDDTSHTVLYVGHDTIAAQYPDAPANFTFVSGSFGERSPGCGAWLNSYEKYRVFRNIKPEANSQYKDVAMSGAETRSN